jgi:hypothetical protein
MAGVCVEEVKAFLHRSNLQPRAAFNAVVFLSQIKFSHSAEGQNAAEMCVEAYFSLFEKVVVELLSVNDHL